MSRLHSTSMTRCWLMWCSILVLLPAACSPAPSSPNSPIQPVAKATQEPMQSKPTCHPSPIMPTQVGQGTASLPEIRGTASGGELWALVFNTVPLPIKQEIKIVWRVTGSGDLQLLGLGPGGEPVWPVWMTPLAGSSWQRPGDEWGAGFILPQPGCWNFHATRGSLTGDIGILAR